MHLASVAVVRQVETGRNMLNFHLFGVKETNNRYLAAK